MSDEECVTDKKRLSLLYTSRITHYSSHIAHHKKKATDLAIRGLVPESLPAQNIMKDQLSVVVLTLSPVSGFSFLYSSMRALLSLTS